MTNRRLAHDLINEDLKRHAVNATDWNQHEAATLLYEWGARFNEVFRLELETPAIAIDRLPIRTLGTYCRGRNGFGLRHEIVLNVKHLHQPLGVVLSVLFHELIHEWQTTYGKERRGKTSSNYHNREFQVMARRFGIIVDDRGHHIGIESGLFTSLLAEHSVDTTELVIAGESTALMARPRGHSTLNKYSCGCTNVRCAVELTARCLRCGNLFEEAAPSY